MAERAEEISVEAGSAGAAAAAAAAAGEQPRLKAPHPNQMAVKHRLTLDLS